MQWSTQQDAALKSVADWLGTGDHQVFRLLAGVREARSIMGRLHPLAVVGFGGYPSFPPLLAAMSRRIDTFIHEQNAVIGRANKVLAYGVTSIASSFPKIAGLPPRAEDKVEFVGNPVRDAVLSASFMSYTAPEANQPFRLLVFGGARASFPRESPRDTWALCSKCCCEGENR